MRVTLRRFLLHVTRNRLEMWVERNPDSEPMF